MYSPIMAFLCFWLLVAVQQPSGCIATKRSSSRQGTKVIPFKRTEMKGGAGPATTPLSRRADNPSGSRFGSRRTRGSNEVAAASLSAATLPSSAEHSGGKAGMSPRHRRQQTLSEVGFLQQQQQQQQQQGGGGEEEDEEDLLTVNKE